MNQPQKHIIMNFKTLGLLSIAAMTLWACKDKNKKDEPKTDQQKPTIEISAPAANAEILQNAQLEIVAILTDNVELESYKVDIHYVTAGDTHKGTGDQEVEWDYTTEAQVNAGLKTYDLNLFTKVPSNAKPGNYHLLIRAMDAAGNENEEYIEFKVVLDTI